MWYILKDHCFIPSICFAIFIVLPKYLIEFPLSLESFFVLLIFISPTNKQTYKEAILLHSCHDISIFLYRLGLYRPRIAFCLFPHLCSLSTLHALTCIYVHIINSKQLLILDVRLYIPTLPTVSLIFLFNHSVPEPLPSIYNYLFYFSFLG